MAWVVCDQGHAYGWESGMIRDTLMGVIRDILMAEQVAWIVCDQGHTCSSVVGGKENVRTHRLGKTEQS